MGKYNSNDDYEYDKTPEPLHSFFVDEQGCYCATQCNQSLFMIDFYQISLDNNIIELLKNIETNVETICKKSVEQSYFDIQRIINNIDYLVTLSYVKPDRYDYIPEFNEKKIVGFALLIDKNIKRDPIIQPENSLYIDIICSNNEMYYPTIFPGGKVLLNHRTSEFHGPYFLLFWGQFHIYWQDNSYRLLLFL